MLTSRSIAVVSVVALALAMYPATAAQGTGDGLVIGAIGQGINSDGAPGVTVDRIHPRDLAPGRADGTDALVLDRAAYGEITSDRDRRSVLQAYLNKGKPVLVEGGDILALNDLINGPLDQLQSGASEGTSDGGAPDAGRVNADAANSDHRFVGVILHGQGNAKVPTYLELLVTDGDAGDISTIAKWINRPGFTGGGQLSTMSTTSTSDNPASWGTLTFIKSCVSSSTYGDVCTENRVMFQYDDGVSGHDFWANIQRVTTYPGIGYYNTNWRTHMQLVYSDVDRTRSDHQLIDYGAPSQDHVDVVTVDVGTTAGEFGARYTERFKRGFDLDHATLTQASSISGNYAYAYYGIDPGTGDSDAEYTTYTGYVVRVLGGTSYDGSFIYRGYWQHVSTGDVVYTGGFTAYSVKPPQ